MGRGGLIHLRGRRICGVTKGARSRWTCLSGLGIVVRCRREPRFCLGQFDASLSLAKRLESSSIWFGTPNPRLSSTAVLDRCEDREDRQ